MCGIFCSLSCQQPVWPSATLETHLQQRGPDAVGKTVVDVASAFSASAPTACVSFCSTVLSLRGDIPVRQPYQDGPNGSTLCWNGEAWLIAGNRPNGNDTAEVFRLLGLATALHLDKTETRQARVQRVAQNVAAALSTVSGPYAFVFFDHVNGLLLFGRDFLGRRSLVIKIDDGGNLLLSSVPDASHPVGWTEVEADGLYCVDLRRHGQDVMDDTNESRLGDHVLRRTSYRFTGDLPATTHRSVGTFIEELEHQAHGKVGSSAALA